MSSSHGSNGINGTQCVPDDFGVDRSPCPRRPIRIGSASGAIGDGLDQVYRLARNGNVDAITADYLAKFNLALKAIEMRPRPDLGYEPHFPQQLVWNDGVGVRLLDEKKINRPRWRRSKSSRPSYGDPPISAQTMVRSSEGRLG